MRTQLASSLGSHAIVIGGSIAGLMAARVLADYFDKVTIFEKDDLQDRPTKRKSTPQAKHIHALMLGGQRVMSSLYEGFTDKLLQQGAVSLRAGIDAAYYFPYGRRYNVAGSAEERHDLGFNVYCQSRDLLEYCVRKATLEFDNIKLEGNRTAQGLLYDGKQVSGVSISNFGEDSSLIADLVVDASGRGSRTPSWLKQLGFQPPEESTVGVDIGYASTMLRVPDSYDEENMIGILGTAPDYPNGAIMAQIENNTWHLTLGGRFGNYPPVDEDGFFGFAKSLHTPKLYNLIKDAKRVDEITQYRFPTSLLRHYERLPAFPERFLVLGDAVSSFNPIYGQGMSSAALQAKALQQLLAERASKSLGLEQLASAYFTKVAEVVAVPWILAATPDFAFPQTTGQRPPDFEHNRQYMAALGTIVSEDPEVYRLTIEVTQLARPMSELTREPLRSRVEARMKE